MLCVTLHLGSTGSREQKYILISRRNKIYTFDQIFAGIQNECCIIIIIIVEPPMNHVCLMLYSYVNLRSHA